jgi:hypothetical protein
LPTVIEDIGIARSFGELHALLEPFRKDEQSWWAWRGQASIDWSLVPRMGRPPNARVSEREILTGFKNRAVTFFESAGYDDWDWLTVAQHYGIPTRLLDWSTSPLTAAFFAVCEPSEKDAAIIALHPPRHFERAKNPDPLNTQGVAVFLPRFVAGRITSQRGMFTLHGPPTVAVEEMPGAVLKRIRIPRERCLEIQKELFFYGTNWGTIYPDLEGVAKSYKWMIDAGMV